MSRSSLAALLSLLLGCQLQRDDQLAGTWRNVDDGALLSIAPEYSFSYEISAVSGAHLTGEVEWEPFDSFRLRFDAQSLQTKTGGVSFDKPSVLCAFCRRDLAEIRCGRAVEGKARNCHFVRTEPEKPLPPLPPVTTVIAGGVYGATLSDGQLYWQDGQGVVRKKTLSDGSTIELAQVSPSQNLNYGAALQIGPIVAGTYVYWALNRGNGGVYRVPLAGGASPDTLTSGVRFPDTLAVNASTAVWSEWPSGGQVIRAVSLSGGTPVTLASTAKSEQHSVWELAVDDTRAYWALLGDSALFSVPLDGSAGATTVAPAPVRNLVRAGDALYWTSEKDVWTLTLPGGSPQLAASISPLDTVSVLSFGIIGLLVEPEAFYLAFRGDVKVKPFVQRFDRATGRSEIVTRDIYYLRRFVGVDSARIYWLEAETLKSGGPVRAVEKKH